MPEQKGDDAKKNEGKIILEVQVHCESTKEKVRKAIIGYPGVEAINIDMGSKKVTLDAPKVTDPLDLFKTVKKRSNGRITKLVHPDPKEAEEKKKKAEEEAKKKKESEKKAPVDVTIKLKVHMHCGNCTKKVEKVAWKIKDVCSVKVLSDGLEITGKDLDPKKVCEQVSKKSGKHAEVVPPKNDKKDEKKDEKKDDNVKKCEHNYSTVIVTQHPYHYNYSCQDYPPQIFSDENPNACSLM